MRHEGFRSGERHVIGTGGGDFIMTGVSRQRMAFKKISRINPFLALADRRLFGVWERMNIHITPKHFYQPIPDSRTLGPELWSRVSELPGLTIDADAMEQLLGELGGRYGAEWAAFPSRATDDAHQFHLCNNRFESVDAEFLYGMIRRLQPRRLIEIGCGRSTLLILQAFAKNTEENPGYSCEYTSIDPFPPAYVTSALRGKGRQIVGPVQETPVELFQTLQAGDILFIDSTHVVRIGGDVQYEFLEVIPRLCAGVFIHLHDIFLPMEYPRRWVMRYHKFWTEQYLLQAFLAFNSTFETVLAGHFLHVHRREALQRWIPSYDPATVEPGSFWMKKCL